MPNLNLKEGGVQSVALSCNCKREKEGGKAPRLASSFPLLRQLGILDLNREELCTLGSEEIHTWVFSYQELFANPLLQKNLSALELERAGLFASKKLSDKYTFARGVLRAVLSRYICVLPEEVCFTYSGDGKPLINSKSLFFNLSHSGELVFIAVSETYDVGVDVEHLRPIPEALSIAGNWFSEMERQWIFNASCKDRAFLRCWVIREAFVKAVGCGLKLPLDSFGVLLPEFMPSVKEYAGSAQLPVITKHVQSGDVQILELTLKNNYLAAIAALRV